MPFPGSWAPRDLIVNGARPSDEMARFLRDNTASIPACLACLCETEKMVGLVSTSLSQMTPKSQMTPVTDKMSNASASKPPLKSPPTQVSPLKGDAGSNEDMEESRVDEAPPAWVKSFKDEFLAGLRTAMQEELGPVQADVTNLKSQMEDLTMSLLVPAYPGDSMTVEVGDNGTYDRGSVNAGKTASMLSDLPEAVSNKTTEQPCEVTKSTVAQVNEALFGSTAKRSTVRPKDAPKPFLSRLRAVCRSTYFETTFLGMIVLNGMVMALEQQLNGNKLGDDLRTNDGPRGEMVSDKAFNIVETVFCVIFTVEVVLKIIAFNVAFFKECFNIMDLLVVVVSDLELFIEDLIPIKSSIIRIVRLVRLGRLMRLVRTLEGFDQLFLMVTAIKGSASVLVWALLLLICIQTALALAITQVLQVTYFESQSRDIKDERYMWKYFGTFTRAMLSLFEMTVGNWVPICRLLVEDVSEWFMFANLAHKFTIGFAVIGVINGVFMRETFKVAETDDNIMMRAKKNAMQLHRKKMERLFATMDFDSDGEITLQEFQKICAVPAVKTWLGAMDLRTDDVPLLFDLIDKDGSGHITMDEMIAGVAKLKGAARSIDMVAVFRDLSRVIRDQQQALQRPSLLLAKRNEEGQKR